MAAITLPDRLVLVRHAWAGERTADPQLDRRRPLDEEGRRQAERLPGQLRDVLGPDPAAIRLLSSPLTRCVDTLRPLADTLGRELMTDERLAEVAVPLHASDGWPDAAWYAARALQAIDAAAPPTGTLVVCSHGEILPALLAALAGHLDVEVPDDIDLTAKAMPKGGAWLVASDGFAVTAIAPPHA